MITVNLTDEEMLLVKLLGGLRSVVSRASGTVDRKMGNQSGLSGDEDGLMGEYAFCKHFNIAPDLAPRTRSGSYDCVYNGKFIDVKSTRVANGRLLATLKDNPDVDIYVLGIIDGQTVTFPGFATKAELCRPENIKDLGHGKGYVLDQSQLRAWK